MIAAKNDEAHRSLAGQLKTHTLRREYEAVVCGVLPKDSGTVSVPIGRHPTDRKRQSVRTNHPREAVTHYTVIARYPGYTHVSCRLETGRTHQIRVHMAYLGHPVAGDPLYGHGKAPFGLTGQCLHAKALHFLHPRTGEEIEVTCPLPDYFEAVLSQLREKA